MPLPLTNFLSTTDSTVLLVVGIVLCAIVLEDVTTVIVGVLVADGLVPIPAALGALYLGIALGDTMWYSIGALARTHQRLARYIHHDFTAPFRFWLEHRYAFKIFSGHFVPGLRSTTYIASGFFRIPLRSFIPPAVAGGIALEAALFIAAYWFGSVTTAWVKELRWGVAAVFLFVLFYLARHNILAYRAQKAALAATVEEVESIDQKK